MLAPYVCWLDPDKFTENGDACAVCDRKLCPYNPEYEKKDRR